MYTGVTTALFIYKALWPRIFPALSSLPFAMLSFIIRTDRREHHALQYPELPHGCTVLARLARLSLPTAQP